MVYGVLERRRWNWRGRDYIDPCCIDRAGIVV